MADGTLCGQVKFPAIGAFISCSYSVVHGIQPGVLSIVIPATEVGRLMVENDNFAIPNIVDDVHLTDGQREMVVKQCRVSEMRRVRAGDGIGYELTLLDRRWKWRFGEVHGNYNQRDSLGKIIPHSRVDVHELAKHCLTAMGEDKNKWKLGGLPNPSEDEALPAVSWDYANPAQALEALVEQFGCRVVYQPIEDTVLIAKPGRGKDLPDESFSSKAPSRMAPPRPEILRFVGAPAAFMHPVLLEAVGEDFDGSIVPIDELSYRPADGWGKVGYTFSHVAVSAKWAIKGKTSDEAIALARKSVFSYYRVTATPTNEGQKVFGLDQFKDTDGNPAELTNWEQIVPLDRQIGADRDEKRSLYIGPAQVFGVDERGAENAEQGIPVRTPFQIDSARGLVIFSAQMKRVNLAVAALSPIYGLTAGLVPGVGMSIATQQSGPAELVLVTSIHVLDTYTLQPYHYTRDRKIQNGEKGLIQVVKRDDVQFAQWVEFKNDDKFKVRTDKDNRKECDKAADHYLDAAEDYLDRNSDTKTYPRLQVIDPDGAIQAITWDVGGGVSTTISRNTEHTIWLPTYQFRRGVEKNRAVTAIPFVGTTANTLRNSETPTG